jgi:tmRNA-binding protein
MKIINRKAQHNYQLIERFEAGIVLAGHEVRGT